MKTRFCRPIMEAHVALIFAALMAGTAVAQQIIQLRVAPSGKEPCYWRNDRTGSTVWLNTQGGRVKLDFFHAESRAEQTKCDYDVLGRSHSTSLLGDIAESSSNTKTSSGGFFQTQGAQPDAADAAELAKKLSNPVASLISVPLQSNFDFGMGAGSGWRHTLNVQPVIPIKLSDKWNLISRTITPIIHQSDVTAPRTSQSGLGDITQSFFFSPNKTEPVIWAVGPVALIPTATDASLGTQKWGLGPTALILKQKSGWTYGVLANHIWSVAGKANRSRVSSTFLQPFLAYTNKQAWTYNINTESTYDWVSDSWAIPINPLVSKLVRFGKQPVSFGAGLKCWVTSPAGGPENCSIRIVVTALFPK